MAHGREPFSPSRSPSPHARITDLCFHFEHVDTRHFSDVTTHFIPQTPQTGPQNVLLDHHPKKLETWNIQEFQSATQQSKTLGHVSLRCERETMSDVACVIQDLKIYEDSHGSVCDRSQAREMVARVIIRLLSHLAETHGADEKPHSIVFFPVSDTNWIPVNGVDLSLEDVCHGLRDFLGSSKAQTLLNESTSSVRKFTLLLGIRKLNRSSRTTAHGYKLVYGLETQQTDPIFIQRIYPLNP